MPPASTSSASRCSPTTLDRSRSVIVSSERAATTVRRRATRRAAAPRAAARVPDVELPERAARPGAEIVAVGWLAANKAPLVALDVLASARADRRCDADLRRADGRRGRGGGRGGGRSARDRRSGDDHRPARRRRLPARLSARRGSGCSSGRATAARCRPPSPTSSRSASRRSRHSPRPARRAPGLQVVDLDVDAIADAIVPLLDRRRGVGRRVGRALGASAGWTFDDVAAATAAVARRRRRPRTVDGPSGGAVASLTRSRWLTPHPPHPRAARSRRRDQLRRRRHDDRLPRLDPRVRLAGRPARRRDGRQRLARRRRRTGPQRRALRRRCGCSNRSPTSASPAAATSASAQPGDFEFVALRQQRRDRRARLAAADGRRSRSPTSGSARSPRRCCSPTASTASSSTCPTRRTSCRGERASARRSGDRCPARRRACRRTARVRRGLPRRRAAAAARRRGDRPLVERDARRCGSRRRRVGRRRRSRSRLSCLEPRHVTLRSGRRHRRQSTVGKAAEWVDIAIPPEPFDVINNVGSNLFAAASAATADSSRSTRASTRNRPTCSPGAGERCCSKRAYLDDVGTFDERFFLYYEDTDLSWRGQLRGWRYVYEPSAVVRHRHAASSGVGSPTVPLLHRTQPAADARQERAVASRLAVGPRRGAAARDHDRSATTCCDR